MEHPPAYFTTKEAAQRVHLGTRTLEGFRLKGTGPAFVKAGRKVLYRDSDLESWLQARTFQSTSEFDAFNAATENTPHAA